MTEEIDMFRQLKLYINSRIPVIWLQTSEESRAENGIANYAKTLEWDGEKAIFGIWSLTGGDPQIGGWDEFKGWKGPPLPDDFRPTDPIKAKMIATPNGGLLAAINWATENRLTPAILIVRDAHCFLKNDYWRRVIKDAESNLRNTLTTIVCISVLSDVPQDIRRNLAFIKPGLPSLSALIRLISPTAIKLKLDFIFLKKNATEKDLLEIKGLKEEEQHDVLLQRFAERQNMAKEKAQNAIISELSSKYATALRGLTGHQASDIITLDYAKNRDVDIARLGKLKAQELASVPGVSFRGEASGFSSIGGFDAFKSWMRKRRYAFGEAARKAKVDQPKGVTLIGIPGNGKTSIAIAAACELGLPFIVFNPSECEGGIVGETATKTMEALITLDALAPNVTLVDEIEKVFGGPGNLDGGSKSGMMRLFLIWLQERKSECFTIITSNDIAGLPPELLRLGRVDQTFWCDLPSKKERAEILNIHLEKRDRKLPQKVISRIAGDLLDGFTGCEIEQICKESHLAAYSRYCEGEDGELTASDIEREAKEITPLADTYQEKLGELRAWAKGRARFASTPDPDDAPRYVAEKPKPKGEVPLPGTPLFQDKSVDAW